MVKICELIFHEGVCLIDNPREIPLGWEIFFTATTEHMCGDKSTPRARRLLRSKDMTDNDTHIEGFEHDDSLKKSPVRVWRRRVAVITGASSGIGQASAQAFAEAGWSLVLAARNAQDLETVASHCRAAGASVLVVPTDVTDAQAVNALATSAREFAGEIDLWFSNVGVGAVGNFTEVPMATHEQIIRANLIGHMNDAHAVLPIFIAQGCGIFINMISLGGFTAAPFLSAYSASKFGLKGFSEALRAELAAYPKIHICDVYPSFVDTPGLVHAGNYTGKVLAGPPPLLDPRQVAAAVVRLADHPRAGVIVGAPSWIARIGHFLSPSLNARLVKMAFERYFASAESTPITDGNVLAPQSDGARIDGGLRMPASKYNSIVKAAVVGALALGSATWLIRRAAASRRRR